LDNIMFWQGVVLGGVLCALALTGCELQDDVQPHVSNSGAAPPASSSASAYHTAATEFPAAGNSAANVAEPTPLPAQRTGQMRFIRGFDAGMKHAASTQMPVMLFFTAEWCHFCHQMAEDAFTNPQVVGLSDRFVCVLVDADAEPEVCKRFRVQGFPTVQFLTPTGAPLNRLIGKKPSHQVMMAMQTALQNLAQRAQAGNRTTR
jgi:thiol:disulfide interchange protein